MVQLINDANDTWVFKYTKKKGGESFSVALGANEDDKIIGAVQPSIKIADDVWDKIKDQVAPLLKGVGIRDTGTIRKISA